MLAQPTLVSRRRLARPPGGRWLGAGFGASTSHRGQHVGIDLVLHEDLLFWPDASAAPVPELDGVADERRFVADEIHTRRRAAEHRWGPAPRPRDGAAQLRSASRSCAASQPNSSRIFASAATACSCGTSTITGMCGPNSQYNARRWAACM